MTAVKRCPRCGQLESAAEFYRRRRGRCLSSYCQPCTRAASRQAQRRRRQDPLAALSEREREVLGLIAEGMSNRAIAARLYVTERTVEAHVTQILQKLRLPESPAQHRRALAVLAVLRA